MHEPDPRGAARDALTSAYRRASPSLFEFRVAGGLGGFWAWGRQLFENTGQLPGRKAVIANSGQFEPDVSRDSAE